MYIYIHTYTYMYIYTYTYTHNTKASNLLPMVIEVVHQIF